jgi:cytochrome c-type biogenesis protein
MDAGNLTLGFAFIAGLASFLSPCVFSLVPAYIGYLGGRSVASAQTGQENRWLTLSHGMAFVFGFSLIFVLVFGLATSFIGTMLYDLTPWLARIGGVIVIVFGLHMTGIIRLSFLEYDLRPQTLPDRRWGYLSSGMMGVFFAAGWSPCVGPILGSIIMISLGGGSPTQAVPLLAAYSAGLAVPFLIAATQIGLVSVIIRRYGKVMRYVEIGMGVLLIIVGILLFMGRFERLASLGTFFGAVDEIVIGQYLLLGLIALLFLGLIPAYIASRKGRSFLDWWVFGVGLFFVALPAAFLIKPKDSEDLEEGGDPGKLKPKQKTL